MRLRKIGFLVRVDVEIAFTIDYLRVGIDDRALVVARADGRKEFECFGRGEFRSHRGVPIARLRLRPGGRGVVIGLGCFRYWRALIDVVKKTGSVRSIVLVPGIEAQPQSVTAVVSAKR